MTQHNIKTKQENKRTNRKIRREGGNHETVLLWVRCKSSWSNNRTSNIRIIDQLHHHITWLKYEQVESTHELITQTQPQPQRQDRLTFKGWLHNCAKIKAHSAYSGHGSEKVHRHHDWFAVVDFVPEGGISVALLTQIPHTVANYFGCWRERHFVELRMLKQLSQTESIQRSAHWW